MMVTRFCGRSTKAFFFCEDRVLGKHVETPSGVSEALENEVGSGDKELFAALDVQESFWKKKLREAQHYNDMNAQKEATDMLFDLAQQRKGLKQETLQTQAAQIELKTAKSPNPISQPPATAAGTESASTHEPAVVSQDNKADVNTEEKGDLWAKIKSGGDTLANFLPSIGVAGVAMAGMWKGLTSSVEKWPIVSNVINAVGYLSDPENKDKNMFEKITGTLSALMKKNPDPADEEKNKSIASRKLNNIAENGYNTEYLDTEIKDIRNQAGYRKFRTIINTFKGFSLSEKLEKYPTQELADYIRALSPKDVWVFRKNLDNPNKQNKYSAKLFQKLIKTTGLYDIRYSPSEIRLFVEKSLRSRGYNENNLLFSKTKKPKPTTFEDEVLWIMALLRQESDFRPFNVSWTGALGLSQMTKGNYEGGALNGAFNPFRDPIQSITKTIIHLEDNVERVNNKTFKNIITAYNRGAGGVNKGLSVSDKEGNGYFKAIKNWTPEMDALSRPTQQVIFPSKAITDLEKKHDNKPVMIADLSSKTLFLSIAGERFQYPLSYGKGVGSELGKHKTPTGNFSVKVLKIAGVGENASLNGTDGVLGASLQMMGLDHNNKNSERRGIFIHGIRKESEWKLGRSNNGSRGCIVLSQEHSIELAKKIKKSGKSAFLKVTA